MILWGNPTFDGYTALHMAAANGDVDTCRALVENLDGGDPFAENDFGETPLHIAASTEDKGGIAVIEFLMRWVEQNRRGDRKFYEAIKRRKYFILGHTTFVYNLTTLWTYAGTYPRLEHSLTERDNGDGRLIRDRAGEIKPFGFEFLHGKNHVNGGKTANRLAKDKKNMDLVEKFFDWREKDVDHDDLEPPTKLSYICCSPKRAKRLLAAMMDF